MSRRCPKCGQFKALDDFGVRKSRVGYPPTSYCRICDSRAANIATQRRKGIPEIRAAMQQALKQHGPLTTVDLVVAVKAAIGDAYPVNPGIIGQNGKYLSTQGILTRSSKKRHGSIWALFGETRTYRRPAFSDGKRVYQTQIGMDAEHLAWMAEQLARAAQRTQRGNIQDFAATVLQPRAAP